MRRHRLRQSLRELCPHLAPLGLFGLAALAIGTTALAAPSAQQVPTGWLLSGNSGTIAGAHFLGTRDSEPLVLAVAAVQGMRIEAPPNVALGGTPNLIGGTRVNGVAAGSAGVAIGGGGSQDLPHRVSDHFGTIAGGAGNIVGNGNIDPDDGRAATVGGGEKNSSSARLATVAGGAENSSSARAATVGGGEGNQAMAAYATVAGGGRVDLLDPASGNWATDNYGTVAGGGRNRAGNANFDPNDAAFATVGGGQGNSASAVAATVSGGEGNVSAATHCTVPGGLANRCIGPWGTVAGGMLNVAAGEFSQAAGRQAKANHRGSYVWADGTFFDFGSTGEDQFSVRATGGTPGQAAVRFITGVDVVGTPIAGVQLHPGANAWSTLSDRTVKQDIQPVDGRMVLEQLAAVPIATWSYLSQDPSIRHIGPMAQDFARAFGFGEDQRHISTVDADGVALAAIQGLHQLVQEKDAALSALQTENAAHREQLEAQQQRIAALEQQLTELRGQNSALEARLATLEEQNVALDTRLESLERQAGTAKLKTAGLFGDGLSTYWPLVGGLVLAGLGRRLHLGLRK
jgi:hypothetical protein